MLPFERSLSKIFILPFCLLFVLFAQSGSICAEYGIDNVSPLLPVAPAASLAATPDNDSPDCAGTAINFTANPSGGVSPYTFDWNFGDGSGISAVENPTYSYGSGGTYLATVTVTDSALTTVSASTAVTIESNPTAAPSADFPVCSETQINFTANPSGGLTPYTFDWNFGDSSGTSSVENPAYTYTTPGTYTASLTLGNFLSPGDLDEKVIISASDGTDNDLFGYTVSINGEYAIVGAYLAPSGGDKRGQAYIFKKDQGGTDNWGQLKILTASDAVNWDHFGYSVSISGDYAIVGSQRYDNGYFLGRAYIFYKDQGGVDNWGELKVLTASDAANWDYFGESVSISGNYAIVGADEAESVGTDRGQAYIFYKDQGGVNNWGEIKILSASDGADQDYFGKSVSISGNYAIVGADGADSGTGLNQGKAYIFYKDQGGIDNWGEVKILTASDAADNDLFGLAVSINGDNAIVGVGYAASGGVQRGQAYIYNKNYGGADNWGEMKILTASNAVDYDRFGESAVSISADYAVVGAFRADGEGLLDSEQGQAYFFKRNHGGTDNWDEVKTVSASDANDYDQFGTSVSISGKWTIVGAHLAEDTGSDRGQAYIFEEIPATVGCQTVETVDIVVNELPSASFTWSEDTGLACDIQFTDNTSGGTPPYSWNWDFGDGIGTSSAQHPVYTYASNGSWTVTLTVADSIGCSKLYSGLVTCNSSSAGEVPENDDIPGSPVSAIKSGNDLIFSHSSAENASAYNMYRGTIASLQTGLYNHDSLVTPESCPGSTDLQVEDLGVLIDGNSYYYLIAATEGNCEGPMGNNSNGIERNTVHYPSGSCYNICP